MKIPTALRCSHVVILEIGSLGMGLGPGTRPVSLVGEGTSVLKKMLMRVSLVLLLMFQLIIYRTD